MIYYYYTSVTAIFFFKEIYTNRYNWIITTDKQLISYEINTLINKKLPKIR